MVLPQNSLTATVSGRVTALLHSPPNTASRRLLHRRLHRRNRKDPTPPLNSSVGSDRPAEERRRGHVAKGHVLDHAPDTQRLTPISTSGSSQKLIKYRFLNNPGKANDKIMTLKTKKDRVNSHAFTHTASSKVVLNNYCAQASESKAACWLRRGKLSEQKVCSAVTDSLSTRQWYS